MIRFRDPDQSLRVTCRWIFPVDQEPIENGLLEVADGTIQVVSSGNDSQAVDLGNVAIVPGLINSHTHLELSDCGTPLTPASPFSEWVRSLMKHRRSRVVDPVAVTAPEVGPVWQGALESRRAGTTSLADIVAADWQPGLLPLHSPRTFAFLEILGLSAERIPQLIERARQHLALARSGDLPTSSAPSRVHFGLSPHAPYSVHPRLLAELIDLSVEAGTPVAMHLAETRAELELLTRGTGEFVEFLKRLGVWNPDVFRSPRTIRQHLEELARAPRGLVVHGNYLSEADSEFLAGTPQLSVVYCPRTHAFFGHEPHPWRQLLDAGINVALGTDSRASNPDLGIWGELQFLHRRHPEMPGSTLLELATIRGARALGIAEHAGTITAGNWADLVVIELPAIPATDPYELLLHPFSGPRESVLGGGWVPAR